MLAFPPQVIQCDVEAQFCRNGETEIVSIPCWQHGIYTSWNQTGWHTLQKHGISVSEIGGVFCVYAILSCFLSATLSNNSHFSAGLSRLHRFVLISICQKATYFFSAQENNSIGKKNHSIAIVYLHYIYVISAQQWYLKRPQMQNLC